MNRTRWVLPVIFAGALLLSACGDDEDTSSEASASGDFPITVEDCGREFSRTTTSWRGSHRQTRDSHMESFHNKLVESGELVDAQGLTAPAHDRRVQFQGSVPVVTDGPYAETAEVIAGYTIVECASFDRATEIDRRGPGEPRGWVRRRGSAPLRALRRRRGCDVGGAPRGGCAAADRRHPGHPAGMADHGRLPGADRPAAPSRPAGAARTASPGGRFRTSSWHRPPTGRQRRAPTPTTRSSCCSCAVTRSCRPRRRSRSPCGRSAA